MQRRATLLIATTAIVVGLSACDPVDPYAAKVNGETIPMDEFRSDLEVLGDFIATQDPASADEVSITAGAARAYLGNLLVLDVARDEAEARGATFSGTEEELDQLISQIVLGAPVSDIPEDMRARLRPLAEAYLAGSSTLLPEEREEFLAGIRCVSHILVATEAEADAVSERLDGGEDFAAVAAEVSTDPGSGQSGGALDTPDRCTSDAELDQFVPEFAAAARAASFGDPTAPVQSDFGFHIILVTEPSPATLESRGAEADSMAPTFFNAALGERLDTADITVDPSIGQWDPAQGVIALGEPPADLGIPVG